MKKLTFKIVWPCFALWLLAPLNTLAQYMVTVHPVGPKVVHHFNGFFGVYLQVKRGLKFKTRAQNEV